MNDDKNQNAVEALNELSRALKQENTSEATEQSNGDAKSIKTSKNTKAKKAIDNENITFDKAVSRLEQIVTRLESGKETLERSIELFEEGSALTKLCEQRLKTARQKVEILCKEQEDE